MNLDMSEAPRWNERTTLIDVQLEWEAAPTPRPVRLIATLASRDSPCVGSIRAPVRSGKTVNCWTFHRLLAPC
jgi:hypothetical protein